MHMPSLALLGTAHLTPQLAKRLSLTSEPAIR